ncbi:HAMP domain-containing protein [Gammaproteobacteria bacterium]|nr:HAMP domain-containing protein [Gammaproteobacteria bacterium]
MRISLNKNSISFFQFRSFRTRLVVSILILLTVGLSLVYFSVYRSTYENTRTVINNSLLVGKGVFQQLIDERTASLFTAIRGLSNDDAFRTSYFTRDYATRLDLLSIHLARIQTADVMMLVNLDYQVEADTNRIGESGYDVPWPYLLDAAEENELYEASSVVAIDDVAYQMLVVPLLSPDLRAWILIGRRLDDDFVEELKQLIGSDVSILLLYENQQAQTVASTLNVEQRFALNTTFSDENISSTQTSMLTVQDEEYVALLNPLVEMSDFKVMALLQQSLKESFEPYRDLQTRLLLLFISGLLVSAFFAVLLGRSVTKPVLTLADRVKLIEKGDYSKQLALSRKDELGQLADSVNTMAEGLAEKEKVRNLLGKVVSPEIAEELLSKNIVLGGEEKVVTILFSDIFNFTDFCEDKPAAEVLALLNSYLTEVSMAIELNKGVVDKYIGDAVMALYGAPVQHDDDVFNALKSALDMKQALGRVNQHNQAAGLPELKVGTGIHTGVVVAGNLGSLNRMNYTVIGDTVNLAARLETLTRKYNVNIIVSAETKSSADEFVYRELDTVIVKGKLKSVTIYELVGHKQNADQESLKEIELFEAMLQTYRCQDWQQAELLLATLFREYPYHSLYSLYQNRIKLFKKTPPPKDWDGIFIFDEK